MIKLLNILILAALITTATVGAVYPQTRPSPRAPATADDSAWLQTMIDAAVAEKRPVLIVGPRRLKIATPVTLRPGTQILATGEVILEAIGLCPTILTSSGNVEHVRLEGLSFIGDGCSGIDATLSWSKIERCHFWTQLYQGARLRGTGTVVEDCTFGVHGDLQTTGTHLALKLGGDGETTHAIVRDCQFFNALGDGAAVEATGMYQVAFEHCTFERNRSRVGLRLAGVFGARFSDCWWENNAGPSLIELRNDATNTIGNYSVHVDNGWMNLNGPGNLWAVDSGGASRTTFGGVNGTNFTNKKLSNVEGGVTVVREGRLVGYRQP